MSNTHIAKTSIFWAILLFSFFDYTSCIMAEKIYLIDDKIITAEIIAESEKGIWVKPFGKPNSVELDILNIKRIENDDGSLSNYSYKTLYKATGEYLKKKDYQEAIKLYGMLIELKPENIHIRHLRAILNHKVGRLKEAKEDYQFMIQKGADTSEILNNIGAIYANDQEYEKALKCFNEALLKDPTIMQTSFNIAQLHMKTQNYKEAIAIYTKILERDPVDKVALFNIGVAYMNSGDTKKAKENLEILLLLDPSDENVKNSLESLNKK